MQAATEKFRVQHHRALETLRADSCQLSGLQIWRKLCRLETLAHACATAYCNGDTIQIRWPIGPRDRELLLREYNFRSDENAWESVKENVRDCIRAIFGHIPKGLLINGDARGYTLKLDPDETTIPDGMHTDWGRNGILAAQINSED